MECSSSPPSSNETPSPPNTLSPKHQTAHPHFSTFSSVPQQHQYPPAAEKFCHPSPRRVHVATQGETDDSAVLLPRPINPAAIPSMAYTSPNLKQLSSAPSFVYPSAGPLMNQHVLQPMWHWILYLHTQVSNTLLLFLSCATNSGPDSDNYTACEPCVDVKLMCTYNSVLAWNATRNASMLTIIFFYITFLLFSICHVYYLLMYH